MPLYAIRYPGDWIEIRKADKAPRKVESKVILTRDNKPFKPIECVVYEGGDVIGHIKYYTFLRSGGSYTKRGERVRIPEKGKKQLLEKLGLS